ncbi:MAG: helix-hairpin-helix domain-containing protein [Solirubrobacterales bacterium]|nr:helix-hairpin-helix domain-containing protein [Solirubrobacterales bacterium]
MRFGASRTVQRITRRFRLVGPNRLPTTRLRVVDVEASGYIGEAARVSVRVRNTGNLRTAATVRTRLVPAPGGRRAARPADAQTATRTLTAGEEARVEFELGKLGDQDYDVDATALAGRRSFGTSTISITPRPERSLWERFKRFVSDHAVLIVALLALLVLAAIAEYTRRYRRRLRAQLAAASPDGGAATSRLDGRVDLNRATAEELAVLPGIGPTAAQRIVEDRDEYGRFTSLEELGRVEGFDAERVGALRDHASV